MKKPLTIPAEAQPRNTTRADLIPTEGFGLEVDGRMKTVFPTLQAALKRAHVQQEKANTCNVGAVPPIGNVPAESHLTSA